MKIEIANLDDAVEILTLQKLAYRSEAEIYGDTTIPPLNQTLEGVEADFRQQVYLKAVEGERILGSVRGYLEDDTCYIGRLIVHPDHQNKGIGTRLVGEIERHFKQANRYELFTGEKSKRNLYLYQKLGYRVYKTQLMTEKVGLVFLEKKQQRKNE
jgi:ribosomal protein S18 acetylase RimI-like enzyme